MSVQLINCSLWTRSMYCRSVSYLPLFLKVAMEMCYPLLVYFIERKDSKRDIQFSISNIPMWAIPVKLREFLMVECRVRCSFSLKAKQNEPVFFALFASKRNTLYMKKMKAKWTLRSEVKTKEEVKWKIEEAKKSATKRTKRKINTLKAYTSYFGQQPPDEAEG